MSDLALSLPFDRVEPEHRENFVGKVAELFQRHPGEWIDAKRVMAVGGAMAWRTRISDARRQYGLVIENRVRRVDVDGKRFAISEYRMVT